MLCFLVLPVLRFVLLPYYRRLTKETIQVLPILNHEEADTGLIFYAAMSNEATNIAERDTDVFLLLLYVLRYLLI